MQPETARRDFGMHLVVRGRQKVHANGFLSFVYAYAVLEAAGFEGYRALLLHNLRSPTLRRRAGRQLGRLATHSRRHRERCRDRCDYTEQSIWSCELSEGASV